MTRLDVISKDIAVSIIIVSYNVCDYIIKCIKTIMQCCNGINYEIIVVDNNSSDNTKERIHIEFPFSVLLIENEHNYGFSYANNVGFKVCKGKYVLFLNPDTEFLCDALSPAIKTLSDNDNAIVSYQLLNTDYTIQMNAATFPNLLTIICHELSIKSVLNNNYFILVARKLKSILGKQIKSYIESSTSIDIATYVDIVPGAFMLLRSADFKLIGMFDENIFLYSEDIDLCKRFINMGKKNVLIPTHPLLHHVGKSSENGFCDLNIEKYKGELYYFKKHHGHIYYYCVKCIFICKILYVLVKMYLRYMFAKEQSRGSYSNKLCKYKSYCKQLLDY